MDADHRRTLAKRRLEPNQRLETLIFQHTLDCAEAIRTLGMAAAHIVAEAGGMREK
jgi:hypothetical protein